MSENNDICVQMEKWSREITKGSAFPRQNNPSCLAWRSLMGTTHLGSSMKHLLSHLKCARETQLIRKNILHLNFNEKLLRSEVSTVKNNPVVKKADISPIIEDLQSLNVESKRLSEQQQHLEMQKASLKIILESRQEEMAQFHKFSNDMQCLKKISCSSNQPSKSSKSGILVQRDIHDILNELKAIRLKLIESYKEIDLDLHDRKLEMWNKIEILLANSSAHLIMEEIFNLAQSQGDQLETLLRNVHMQEDSDHLSESSINASEEIEKGVQELLMVMCAKHVSSRINAHKVQYAAKCAEAATIVVKSNAIDSFKKTTSVDLKYAEDVINMKLDIVGKNAALSRMATLRIDLDRRIQLAKTAERHLVDEYRKIADFDEQVNTSLFHIKGLELNQGMSDDNINKELDVVDELLSTSISKMTTPTPFRFIDDEFRLCIRNLRDRVGMCSSKWDSGPILLDLSGEQSRNVSALCSHHITWDNLLMRNIQQKQINRQLKQEVARDKTDCEAMSSVLHCSNFSRKHAQDLFKKCVIHDETLTSEVTPILQKCCGRLSANYKKVLTLNNLIEDWWNQPCQRIKL